MINSEGKEMGGIKRLLWDGLELGYEQREMFTAFFFTEGGSSSQLRKIKVSLITTCGLLTVRRRFFGGAD
jgi:hypothetical protein